MFDLLAAVIAFGGSLFLLVATVALFRMPDIYGRLSAISKAVTLGASLMLLGAAFASETTGVTARIFAGIAFMFSTSPIAGHVVARAAWRTATRPVVAHQDEFETTPEWLREGRPTVDTPPPPGPIATPEV